jgi:hypothetical protein
MARLIALLAAAITLALPTAAQAHGLVGRRDLPVPAWLFAWAAAAVLLVSFVGLGALWNSARMASAGEKKLFSVPRWFQAPIGALGVACLGLIFVSGFFGIQIDTANFTPTAIFVGLWVAVPFASLLLGDIYAALNPLRALGRLVGWIGTKVSGGNVPEPLVMPDWIGRWPAAFGLLAFAWVELAFPGKGDPSQLAVIVVLFCLVMAVGMSLYGTDPFIKRCDPFAAWFGWVATLAPLRWDAGTLYLRPPGVGTAKRRAIPGDAAIVIVAIGTTTWDGLSGGDLLGTTLANLGNDVAKSGLSVTWSNALVDTIGMLVMVGLVAALVFAGVRGMLSPAQRKALTGRAADGSVTGPPSVQRLVRDFAPALVPIGVAYAVGHYVSLLAFQGQALPQLLSNPLGHELQPGDGGWLGTAQWSINYSWLSSNAIWYLQVAALVTGHVMSLVLSHDRALERFPKKRAARSQRAMLVVAVVFTCTGLWLLSSVG